MENNNNSRISGTKTAETDYFRDTPIRYLGYANEVGESFRPIFPRFVVPSYVLAFAYVGADTLHKSHTAYLKGKEAINVVTIGTDTLLWQTFASVLIPGKIINIITTNATRACNSKYFTRLIPRHISRWCPTLFGLSCIPLIIEPIDRTVDFVMDRSIRTWYRIDQ